MGSHAASLMLPSRDAESTAESLLVRSLQRGEPGVFRTFVERYQSQVFSLLNGLLGDPARVDELAQRVFVEAHRSLREIAGDISPLAWLYEIAMRQAMADVRKAKHGAIDPRRKRILEILAKLREKEGLLVVLRDVQGYSVPALSGIFRVPEDQIRADLLQARTRIFHLMRRAAE